MEILCIICQDLLISTEDIFFIRCGHVFHHRCLSQWLERSNTCPHCRDAATVDRIHKAHLSISNSDQVDDSLQGRIDNLQFQVLLNERNIKHNISKNAILEKQNAGLRQEVRKVESEISQKNSTIHALKEQINYFNEMLREHQNIQEKLIQKEREVEQFRDIYKTLSKSTLEDVQNIVGRTTDRNTLINYISMMKKITLRKTKTIKDLRDHLAIRCESLQKERSKRLDVKLRFEFYESENISLRQRISELEHLLYLTSDQNYVTKSSSPRNSNEKPLITQTQVNTKQETVDQNDPSSSEAEVEIITDANQEKSVHNSTLDECSIVTKKAKVCLRSGNSSDKANDVITNDVKNIARISSQSTQKKMLKLKSPS